MKTRNFNFYAVCLGFLALALTGCASAPKAQGMYFLDAREGAEEPKEVLPVSITVEPVVVREAMKGRDIMASPAPYKLVKRAGAEWAESASGLFGTLIYEYLAPRCQKVVPGALKGREASELTLLVYLDTLAQVKRGPDWLATLNLAYEVQDKKGKCLVSGTFYKSMPLESGDLDLYASAQSVLAREWLERLLATLKDREIPKP